MGRLVFAAVAAVLLLAAGAAIYVYQLVTSLEHERVTEDVAMVVGAGGNVGVLATQRGAVVVDSMTFQLQGRRIRELAELLGRGPVQVVVNTHYHRDHTHGNPGFAPGTQVVATQRTLEHLQTRDGDYWRGAAAGTLPNDTFGGAQRELRVGGKTLRLYHPGRGHTDGDLVVLFVEDRVLHTGDLVFNGRYPNIDLEAGGSIERWIATLDAVMELPFERVIPGHGPVTDRAGIEAFQRFLRELWGVGLEAARSGRTLRETLAAAELREDEGYGVIAVPFVFRLDRDFVIGRAWQEATAREP